MADDHRDNATGVRRLGFGVSGPHASPLIRPETTVEMIHLAYALGIRLFDTGPAYGAGEGERRLGEALARIPTFDPIVATKVGILPGRGKNRARDFSPDGVRRSVEGSLKRLRRSRIDWLFLHGPAPHELTDKLIKTLGDLQREGRVVSLGVCGRGPELDIALQTGEFTHFMAPVNVGLTPEDMERLYRLRSAGELIGIETLAAAHPRFPWPRTAGSAWRLARSLMGWSSQRPPTPMMPDEALCWALGEGGAHRVVTTTSNREHLEANVLAVTNCGRGGLITG